MSYEFKKISDVNVIESIDDNANILVENNGEIAKIAASNFAVNSGNSGSSSAGGSAAPIVFKVSGGNNIALEDLDVFMEQYFAGRTFVMKNDGTPYNSFLYPQKIVGFYISFSNAHAVACGKSGTLDYFPIANKTTGTPYSEEELKEAFFNYLGE